MSAARGATHARGFVTSVATTEIKKRGAVGFFKQRGALSMCPSAGAEGAPRADFPVYGSGSFSVDGRSGPDRPTVTHE
jgi:hypothetical protein